MGIHWHDCVIRNVRKVEWNTFVLSVTISHLAYFGTATPKYGVFCVFNQLSSLKALTTDVVTAILFWIITALYNLGLSLARYPGNL
jgi:hypothetical protein